MVLKKELARRIVMELHGEELAKSSEEYFETRFQKGDLGNVNLPTISLKVIVGGGSAADTLVTVNLVGSKSEARRLIYEHAVEVNGIPVTSASEVLKLKSGDIIKVGKKRSVKIT